MRKTFEVYGEGASEQNLFIEIGKKHIACCSKLISNDLLHSVEFFHFNEINDDYEKLFEDVGQQSQLLGKTFENTQIVWSNEECICIPSKYNESRFAISYLSLMFGDLHTYQSFSQNIGEYALHYRITASLYQAVAKLSPSLRFTHQYNMLLQANEKNELNNNVIRIILYPDYFILTAYKDSQLQLIQTRDYADANDVLYYIINVCKQYNFDTENTNVIATGMIDSKSNLYNTLYQYIHGFAIADVNGNIYNATIKNEYPLHFFSHFVKYKIV